ncbi:hypothetical protein Tco_0986639, partial [Tanacetum coccineum]
PLEDSVRCQRCTCVWCGHYLEDGFCSFCNSEAGNSFVDDSNPNSFNDPPNVFTHPPQPQYESYLCSIKDYRNEKIDICFRRECENMIDELKGKFNGMSIEINKKKELQQLEQAAKLSTYTTEPSRRFNYFYDDDDEESSIPLREIFLNFLRSIASHTFYRLWSPEDSLIMGNEELSTIPEKESEEFIKSSVEDLVPILSESKDNFESDSDCDLSSCDDLSPINVYEEKSMTFSNPSLNFI